MQKKFCKYCDNTLEINKFPFYKTKHGLSKRRHQCINCYYSKFKDKRNQTKRENYNPKKKSQYYFLNKEKIKARTAKTHIQRRKTDVLYRLSDLIRSRTKKALICKSWKKTTKFYNYIGCTLIELKFYLENQFTTGMTWENQGQWHIDHIIPLSSAKNKEEMYKLCHYTNLQPLWAIDNIKKGDRYQSPSAS